MNQNLVFYDFETTGVDPNNCDILEFAFILIKANENKAYSKSYKIQFNKNYNELTKSELAGLNFNKIYSQKDLDEHNSKAISINQALGKFISYLNTIFDYKSFLLIGYNNFQFDNIILSRFISQYYPKDFYYILNNSYDIFKFICDARKINIDPYDWNLHFRMKNRKLETMYKHIFSKSDLNFHQALDDVRATMKLFFHYNKYFPKVLAESIENNFCSYDGGKFQVLDLTELSFNSASEVDKNVL